MTESADMAADRLTAVLAETLADVLRVDQVPVDGHFFDDLGANSLVMAHFCALVRKRADLPSVSMKDVYRNPTIGGLASALGGATRSAVEPSAVEPTEHRGHGSTPRYLLCGVLQFLIFLGYSSVAAVATTQGYGWVGASSGVVDIYVRSVLFGGAGFVGMCVFPIVAKWLVVGRWKAGEFPVWGLAYVRFWVVKALLHANPMIFFVGSPLYVLYLRALGARIGKGVTILSRNVPVCTDLLAVGAGSVIRKDSFVQCYRAHAGHIQTGPVTLGRDVLVGEKTVLDINTSMGDGAQLGHTSALHSGQSVPAGQRWHGSPAQRTELNYLRVAPASCGTARRVGFGLVSLLQTLLLYVPLVVGGGQVVAQEVPALDAVLAQGTEAIASADLWTDALILSLALFLGFVVAGFVAAFGVARLLNLMLKPDKVYPLYGLHYSTHRAIARLTTMKSFAWFFGDSSYIVNYLRGLGYDLSTVEQTGSNFGTDVRHDNPYLSAVGRGTMVADGLSIINADFSSTSFRVSRAVIGPHNFLGNHIAYPAGGRTGDNCLLATKVMVPLDGEVRAGVGLLGSPSFEIPRSVDRDGRFDQLRAGDELRRRLAAKNRYNIGTMAIFLFLRWLHVYLLTVLGLASVDLADELDGLAIAMIPLLGLVITTGYFVFVERVTARFRPLRPRLCSIYDPYFWWHERLWKVPDHYLNVFNGTPFKNAVWRLLGARFGSRVFDDGCYLTERTLTNIGDDCTLNAGSKIQCHSQEDGTFKSDHSTIGAGCTLGVGALVHYGVTMGEGAVLAADSFLMKGEEIPPRGRWGGNPATPDASGVATVTVTEGKVNGNANGVRPGVLARRASRRRLHHDPTVDAHGGDGCRRA
ncbi:Pls/PosA family non-ribosomal peptide synthetase [Kutzneria sp. 744]|uniref:Pls/PosA family non-ribosomal peptide synthetase n=1 Tax=Kutzneria sp. (strain 744) TaxID=345341 RepID=UPI0004B3828C|nr:Pls/PosA family non-ribosomal peptide synthetase [Kutzneria sp. 744]